MNGKQVYKHKTKQRYIRNLGQGTGWTVGPNPTHGYYFSKKHKIMRFLASLFLQYNFIPTENGKPGNDEPWITRKFGNLYIDCA